MSVAGCDGAFSHGRPAQPAHTASVFCSNLLVSISTGRLRQLKVYVLTQHAGNCLLEEANQVVDVPLSSQH